MKRGLFILSLILLSACSSAPIKVQYYLLGEPKISLPITNGENTSKVVKASLDKLVLAKYLRQNKLTILDGNQLYFANQHLWAEDLNKAIASALAQDVNEHSKVKLLLRGEPEHRETDYKVELKVEHLVATQRHTALLKGHLWLLNKNQVLIEEAFIFSLPLEQAGFAHSVKQQRELVSLLAQKIEAALTLL